MAPPRTAGDTPRSHPDAAGGALGPCCYTQLTNKCNSLGDVHGGHAHAESLHLQSEEQRHKEVSEEILFGDARYKIASYMKEMNVFLIT